MTVGRRIVNIYKGLLVNHAYKVQSLQTSFLLATGDVLSQTIEPPVAGYDYKRTIRFAIIGAGIGPVLLKWYKVLDNVFGTKQNFKTVIKKVAVDQIVMAPVMLAAFISTVSLMEGQGLDFIKARFKNKYTDILLANYKVWPAVQIITFSMPLQFRVLFVQIVALGWNTYLAWKINVKIKKYPKS